MFDLLMRHTSPLAIMPSAKVGPDRKHVDADFPLLRKPYQIEELEQVVLRAITAGDHVAAS